jgi:hypothetical protein
MRGSRSQRGPVPLKYAPPDKIAAAIEAGGGGGIGYTDNGDGTITLTSGAFTDNGDGTITIGA